MPKHTNRFVIILGVIGSICFSVSAVPEVWSAFKTHYVGVTHGTLMLWSIGELCSLIYVIFKDRDKIQIMNYFFNLMCIAVLIYYKYAR